MDRGGRQKRPGAGAYPNLRVSPGPCPAMRPPVAATPGSTTTCSSPTSCGWATNEEAGRASTPACSATTSTLPPPSAAWRQQPRRSSWATASRPTRGVRVVWAVGPSPASLREAWEVHANRSVQIDEAVGPDASYQARSVAARATRDRKTHERRGGPRRRCWRDELARAGYPPVELSVSVERAGIAYEPPGT